GPMPTPRSPRRVAMTVPMGWRKLCGWMKMVPGSGSTTTIRPGSTVSLAPRYGILQPLQRAGWARPVEAHATGGEHRPCGVSQLRQTCLQHLPGHSMTDNLDLSKEGVERCSLADFTEK